VWNLVLCSTTLPHRNAVAEEICLQMYGPLIRDELVNLSEYKMTTHVCVILRVTINTPSVIVEQIVWSCPMRAGRFTRNQK